LLNAKEIKDRIKGVENTRKITNAMYMIASSKMKKAKNDLDRTRPYFDALHREVKRVFRTVEGIENRYFYPADGSEAPDGTYGLLVITTDKGLAGAYNKNISKKSGIADTASASFIMAKGVAGFAKKILLANVAGEIWNAQAAIPLDQRTVAGAWLGLICYAFQIYFDFSGYSDMAIGLGKMIGFKFLENFNYPYIARSITDFWRRWHMSLSTWFREYVYFPLGGSRCSTIVNIRNLLVVWFLTGLWHGASWNYVLWGLYYFVLLVIEKQLLQKFLSKLPAFFQHFYTLFFILFGWLLFVFEDLSAGTKYLGNMFGVGTVASFTQIDIYNIVRLLPFIAVCVIASTPLPKRLFYRLYEKYTWVRALAYTAGVLVFVLGLSYLVDSFYNPFLYFRF
jgi:hypothetical protein